MAAAIRGLAHRRVGRGGLSDKEAFHLTLGSQRRYCANYGTAEVYIEFTRDQKKQLGTKDAGSNLNIGERRVLVLVFGRAQPIRLLGGVVARSRTRPIVFLDYP